MPWHWIDIIIIAIIALSVITGLVRGFVKEAISLCTWVLAIWVALNYSQSLIPWLSQYLHEKKIQSIAAFIILFIGILLAGSIVNFILGFILKSTGLGGTDKLLGLGFGFLSGVFIVALIIVAVKMTSLPHEQYSKESKLYAHFNPVEQFIYMLMPDFIRKVQSVEAPEVDKESALTTYETQDQVNADITDTVYSS